MNIDFSPLYLSLKVACFATLLTIYCNSFRLLFGRCILGQDLLDSLLPYPCTSSYSFGLLSLSLDWTSEPTWSLLNEN